MRAVFMIGLAAMIAANLAQAAGTGRNQYKWRDASGALHYSDALPPEANRFGYEVVNGQGVVIKRVERAKTPEERAAAKVQEAKDKATRAAAEQQARDDEILLSKYADEADLKKAQQDRLANIDQDIKTARMGLRAQEQTLADLLDRAAAIERSGKTLPEAQAEQLAKLRGEVDAQHQAIRRREIERDNVVTGFQTEIAHYRKLKEQQAAAKAATTP